MYGSKVAFDIQYNVGKQANAREFNEIYYQLCIAEIQQILVNGGEQNYGAEHARVKYTQTGYDFLEHLDFESWSLFLNHIKPF